MDPAKIDEMLANPELARYLVTFTTGQIIFLEGDDSEDLYLLVAGQVEIFKGDKKIKEIIDKGSVFGEMSFFLGEKRTASVKAKNNVEVIRIPKEEIKPILNQFPAAGLEITRHLAQWLSETSQILYGLKELSDQLPDAVMLTDRDGNILTWNTAAEKLYGRDWQQMNAMKADEIYAQPQLYRDFLKKVQNQYAGKEKIFDIHHSQKGKRCIATSFTLLYDGHHNFQGVLSLGRDVTETTKLENKYKRTFFWLISALVLIGLLTVTIFYGYPYFSKGHQYTDFRQQELTSRLAGDFFLLKSMLVDLTGSENQKNTNKVIENFFKIQQAMVLPYTGLILLDLDKKVVNAYSTTSDADGSEMTGSSYAAIEFQGSENSLHKVLTVYRTEKGHPMGKKGIEIAFPLYKNNAMMGWLVFQMNMDVLAKIYYLEEEDLKKLEFDKL